MEVSARASTSTRYTRRCASGKEPGELMTSWAYASSAGASMSAMRFWASCTASGSPSTAGSRIIIAMPKSNGYQSLHTTDIAYGASCIEIQIRTREMHLVAEYVMHRTGSTRKARPPRIAAARDHPIINSSSSGISLSPRATATSKRSSASCLRDSHLSCSRRRAMS